MMTPLTAQMRRLLAPAIVLLLAGPVAAAEDPFERALLDHALQVAQSGFQLAQGVLGEGEAAQIRLIRDAADGAIEEGALAELRGREVRQLTLREAIAQGLERNLTVAVARDVPNLAQEALEEVKAVFDPRLNFSVSYNWSDTFYRSRFGLVRIRSFQPLPSFRCVLTGSAPIGDCPIPDQTNPNPQVVAFAFRPQTAVPLAVEEIVASEPADGNGPTKTTFYTLSVNQQLPWGPSITIGHTTRQEEIFYRTGNSWDDAEWTANANFSLATPFPFTKDWGYDSPRDAAIRRQRLNRDIADWTLQQAINDTLLAINGAYFDLSFALESLYVASETLGLAEERLSRTLRQFDEFLVTNETREQVEAEYYRAQLQVERSRAAYITASLALGRLIESAPEVARNALYVPVGAAAAAAEPFEVPEYGEALEIARAQRPDIKLAELGWQVQDLNVAVARNQARPDVDLSASVAANQSHEEFGFRNPLQASGNLVRPDSLTTNFALSYTYPLMNRAANAAVERSQLSQEQLALDLRGTHNRVSRELKDALTRLETSRARLALAETDAENAETAFARMNEDEFQFTALQYIVSLRNLLNARQSLVAARADLKRAEGQVLAAQGIIASALAARASVSAVDRARIEALGEAGALRWFAPRLPS